MNGLIIYRGRGGAAGSRNPRKPKPAPGAAALELEEPKEERRLKKKVPRKLRYNGGGDAIDEALRELGGEPGRIDEPDRRAAPTLPGTGHPKPIRYGVISPPLTVPPTNHGGFRSPKG